MKIGKESAPQMGQQGNLDFDQPETADQKRKLLIRSIQRKRFTSEKLTSEEQELARILSEEERQDDQYRH